MLDRGRSRILSVLFALVAATMLAAPGALERAYAVSYPWSDTPGMTRDEMISRAIQELGPRLNALETIYAAYDRQEELRWHLEDVRRAVDNAARSPAHAKAYFSEALVSLRYCRERAAEEPAADERLRQALGWLESLLVRALVRPADGTAAVRRAVADMVEVNESETRRVNKALSQALAAVDRSFGVLQDRFTATTPRD
jgi:hypothetical protein